MDTSKPLPPDLAGYQLIANEIIRADDILVEFFGIYQWASQVAATGRSCNADGSWSGYRVYRMIPTPQHLDDKPTAKAVLPDTGARREFGTGAVRDASVGKGHFHSIPPIALRKLAQRFEDGARKYAKNNWMKGIPLSAYQDSLSRHLLQFAEGDTSEDHAGALIWNACAMVWTEDAIRSGRLPKELDDLPYRTR